MILFVAFVLLGLILGVGMMLAPALPTTEPRVAAGAVLSFALVLSSSLFHAALFGWNILIVDYLWFSLIMIVFLGGTLTIGMQKVEQALAAGENATLGWPGIPTMGVFILWGLVFMVLVSMQVDLNAAINDTKGLSESIATMQESVRLDALPDVPGRLGPGAPSVLTYFATQLPSDLSETLGGLLVAVHILFIWMLYDLGKELGLQRTATWVLPLAAPLIAVLFGTDIVMLMGALFVVGFWLFTLRWTQQSLNIDLVASAICAAAAVLTHPATVGAMILVYSINLLIVSPRQQAKWRVGALLLPLLTLISIWPWLLTLN